MPLAERIAGRVGNVDAGGRELAVRHDRARKLTLLRAPIGGIEHLGGGAESAERIQKFIALRAVLRQALTSKGQTQGIPLRRVHIDGGSADIDNGTPRFQGRHDLARRRRIKARI